MHNKQYLQAHIYVLIATLLIAGSFPASAKLSGVIDPVSLTLFRFVFAAVLLSPLIFLRQRYRSKIKRSFKKTMIISLFYSLYFMLLFKALEYTTALNTGTLYTLVPILTALFAIFFFKQQISLFQLFVYLLGIIGTCMVVFQGDIQLLYTLSLNYGDFLFLFAVVSMVLFAITTRYLYEEGDDVIVLTFMTLVGGSLWMSGAMITFDIPLEWEKIKGELFIYMAYLTIGTTLITVFLNQKATVILGPKKVMSYVYLNPAAVALLVFIFEGISISFWSMIGIGLSGLATILLLSKE